MNRKWLLVFFSTVLAGAALHFLYGLWPNILTALVSPVNESVWEHLKLLYWPFLAASFVLARDAPERRTRWCALLRGLLFAPALLLGLYYPLTAGFGLHGLWVDVSLYVLAMAGGFFLAYRRQTKPVSQAACGLLVITAGMLGAALALFTFAPPEVPIFL